MTQAAVSWQIRALEDRLGMALFERRKPGLALTPVGATLAPKITDALVRLANAFQTIERSPEKLRVSAAPTFSHSWLARHLGHFQALHPGIELEIDATTEVANLHNGQADVAIRRGKGNWHGLVCQRLLPVILAPICAPSLLAAYDHPPTISDLAELPMLQPETLWNRWFADLKQPVPTFSKTRTTYPRQHLVIEAALAGQGVALLNPIFCAEALSEGRLVHAVSEQVVSEDEGYWLVYSATRAVAPMVESFRLWLGEEIARTTKFEAQIS